MDFLQANIYDGAERTWHEALRFSGVMQGLFAQVELRWPDAEAADPNTGNGAFARTTENYVAFSGSMSKRPQSAVSHEMGHIASSLAHPRNFCGAFNYCPPSSPNFPCNCRGEDPGANCTGSWNLTSSEHYCAGFEEALAMFLGNVAYYWDDARVPTSCVSEAPCTAPAHNMETSSGTSCAAEESRRVLHTVRYLRDVYDKGNDPGFEESVSVEYFRMIGFLADFEPGTLNGQTNEPWNEGLTEIDDQDGRSALDYRKVVPANTLELYSQNCSPGGD